MRIMDLKTLEALEEVLIMLTPAEAHELSGKLRCINPEVGDHIHVNDHDFSRGITVAIYTPDNLHYFDSEVQRIIQESG